MLYICIVIINSFSYTLLGSWGRGTLELFKVCLEEQFGLKM